MKLSILILAVATIVACRDVSRSPGGPNFAVTQDTIPGGCDAARCHFNSRGAAAFTNWFDPGTSVSAADTGGGGGGGVQVFGFVSVSRNATAAFLSYGITECRFSGCSQVRSGFGTIPNEDVTGNGKSLVLSTNTTGNPNFFTFAGPTGIIEASWTPDGQFELHTNGTSQRIQPGFRENVTGQSDDVSATASGSLVGYGISPSNSGSISTNHNVSITISR